MNTLLGIKFSLHRILSTIFVCALQASGPSGPLKRPDVPPKTVARSEAMASYVIAGVFGTSEESFQEFETRYGNSAKGEKPLSRIADFATAEGVRARIEQGDSKMLLQELSQNTSIILVVTKDGYVATCHPRTDSMNMIVTTAFNGMEPIEWDDWDGQYLVAEREERLQPANEREALIAIALTLVIGLLVACVYIIWKRK
jgi:hypothetical protein